MFSIAHLHAVTDHISDQVAAEIDAKPTKPVLSAWERKAAEAEREQVLQHLDAAIAKTESLLSDAKSDADPSEDAKVGGVLSAQAAVSAEIAEVSVATLSSVPDSPDDTATKVSQRLMAKGDDNVDTQTKTLTDMAKGAEPIVKTFDAVLSKPGLNGYNASLNTAPIVGIKGKNIMYVQTKGNRSILGNVTDDVWSVFSAVPDGFDISKGSTKLFPYQGYLYLANGTSAWVKKCRPRDDTVLKDSLNNWPKMYYDTWEKVGDNVFPANNILDIVPWAQLSADYEATQFRLTTLNADGSLQVLKQETITNANIFDTLAFSPKDDKASKIPPSWTRIAYFNGDFVGYDKDFNLWTVKPDFTNMNYKIENKYAVGQDDTFSEFTANDVGLIVAKKDGFLYKRIMEDVDPSGGKKAEGGDETRKMKWTKWLAQDGVLSLGVASPGVILDLETLTKSLRSRYLETQAALWPVVSNIKAFAGTHEIFLNQMNAQAKIYADSTDAKKQATALRAGKMAVGHAKAWSKILTTTVEHAKTPIDLMAKQLKGVSTDLKQQIGILNTKLVGLRATLGEQEKALNAANVGFWVGIGSLLVGLVVVIVGLATANPLVIAAGGVLFVGGIITASVSASKANSAAAAVAKTKAEIEKVTTAVTELEAVTADFDKIGDMYDLLKQFWGRMLADCNDVSSSDTALLTIIGQKFLVEDSPSYEMASEATGRLKVGAEAYLDLIAKQGIRIPKSDDDSDGQEDDDAQVASLEDSKSNINLVAPTQVSPVRVAAAQEALLQGDVDAYEPVMVQTTDVILATVASLDQAQIQAGYWFDIGALRSSASVFSIVSLQAAIGVATGQSLAQGASAIGSLIQSQKKVRESLGATVELCKIMSTWSTDPFSDDGDKRKEQIAKYKAPALRTCHLARDTAMIANNTFADINHLVRDYAEGVRQKIGQQDEYARIQHANLENEIRNIDIPFALKMFAPGALVQQFVAMEAERIKSRYRQTFSEIQGNVERLRASLNSFATCQGSIVSWENMVQVINKNLAATQSNLDAIGTLFKADAVLYHEVMLTNWNAIGDHANEVLSIIGLPNGTGNADVDRIIDIGRGILSSGIIPGLSSVVIQATPKLQLQAAVSVDSHLSKDINKSNSSFKTLANGLGDLQLLEHLAEYNSGVGGTTPITTLDVVTDLRRTHARLAAANFDNVTSLRLLAGTQIHALKRLNEPLRRDILIKHMLIVIGIVKKKALNTSEAYAGAGDDFEKTCRTVEYNVKTFAALIKDIDAAVAKEQKEIDKYIAGLVADALAVVAASAAIAAGIVAGPGAAWKIISKVPSIYSAQDMGFRDILKSWYTNMDISAKADCIGRLKVYKTTLETISAKLNTARDAFGLSVISAQATFLDIARMHARLTDISTKVQNFKSISFDDEEMKEIEFEWNEVDQHSEAWIDTFSVAGINPLLYQADEDLDLGLDDESNTQTNGVHGVNGNGVNGFH